MGRKFVIAMLAAMIVFSAYFTEFVPIGFPVQYDAEVYAVLGNKKVLLSDEDAGKVKKLLGRKYDRGYSGKCPFDFNIGFEIGNYRYAIAMDGCSTVNMYSVGGEYIYGGGTPFPDSRSVTPYYFKYFDDDDI